MALIIRESPTISFNLEVNGQKPQLLAADGHLYQPRDLEESSSRGAGRNGAKK